MLEPHGDEPLATEVCHGDFQPGNILQDGECYWLIDWEYSARRQLGYDALVYGLQARFPKGLGRRLTAFARGDLAERDPLLNRWSGVDWTGSPRRRRVSALVLALEELVLRLEESSVPCFTALDRGLPILVGELAGWLQAEGSPS